MVLLLFFLNWPTPFDNWASVSFCCIWVHVLVQYASLPIMGTPSLFLLGLIAGLSLRNWSSNLDSQSCGLLLGRPITLPLYVNFQPHCPHLQSLTHWSKCQNTITRPISKIILTKKWRPRRNLDDPLSFYI